jgi:hypothetical protein
MSDDVRPTENGSLRRRLAGGGGPVVLTVIWRKNLHAKARPTPLRAEEVKKREMGLSEGEGCAPGTALLFARPSASA